MSGATSRFFTFDLGLGDFEKLKKTFSLSVVIHIFTALVILILGETVGLWFLNTQLIIPAERMEAANFVYQFSVISACIGILQVPYMAAVTAHERMNVFAYAGIADAVFKLAIALALGFAPIDKLKFLSILGFVAFIIMITFYRIYCHKNFPETHFKWFWNKKMFWERIKFSGYESISWFTNIFVTQSGVFLVNRFYGVLLNAAIGVSQQVVNAANQFTGNFLAATAPQITKSLAKGEMDYFHNLIIRSSKFCFLLSFMFMAPLALQIKFVLSIWLKIVPDYTGIFCQLAIINTLVYISTAPIWSGIVATGKNKRFRIIDSLIAMINFPLIYLGLHFSPIGFSCPYILINAIRVIYAIFSLRKLTGISVRQFISQSIFKSIAIGVISTALPIYITLNMSGWQGFFVCLSLFLIVFVPSALLIGLNGNERKQVMTWVSEKLKPHH
jgi:O-antigen/teichoic acid export membrane protein